MDSAYDRLQWKHVLWKSRKLHTPKEVSKLVEDRDGLTQMIDDEPLLVDMPFQLDTMPILFG